MKWKNYNWKEGIYHSRYIITYHPRLSAKPLHSVSVLTILSINFFHNIPSEITRCHSLQTSSAEHNDLASRYDKMFSAIWSRPFAEKKKKNSHTWNPQCLTKMVRNQVELFALWINYQYRYIVSQHSLKSLKRFRYRDRLKCKHGKYLVWGIYKPGMLKRTCFVFENSLLFVEYHFLWFPLLRQFTNLKPHNFQDFKCMFDCYMYFWPNYS